MELPTLAPLRPGICRVLTFCMLFLAISIAIEVSAGLLRSDLSPGQYLQKQRTFHSESDFARLTQNRLPVARTATEKDLLNLFDLAFAKPVRKSEVRVLMRAEDGSIWLGTDRGAFRYSVQADYQFASPEYFASKRWLPDDRVTGIAAEKNGRVIWIETPAGFSRIEYKPMRLSEKSRAFIDRIRARHVRWGMTSDSILKTPGDLSTNQMVSSDNDGLWTQMYIAAESFRHAVTGEKDARDNAAEGFRAMLRLEQITGISGFPARSFIKIGEDLQPGDGEWHTTADGVWRWKGDTSSDEIVGHYFGFAVYYDLVANDAEKEQIRGLITRMTDHILKNDYQLIDLDGKRTRWGWWGPDTIWEDPDETGLRALHLLAHLQTAIHITGEKRYRQAYHELIDKHRYHLLVRNQKILVPGHINHSDDELAFLSFYPLLQYENDPKLREVYEQALERSWQIERPERNPLWNFIYAAGTGSREFDREESIRTLREIPMDQISWSINNSFRLDLPFDKTADRFNRKQSLSVLPYDELPMSKWNGNPYRVDGGNGGRSEDDGAYYLLPYWMGRHHKLISE